MKAAVFFKYKFKCIIWNLAKLQVVIKVVQCINDFSNPGSMTLHLMTVQKALLNDSLF